NGDVEYQEGALEERAESRPHTEGSTQGAYATPLASPPGWVIGQDEFKPDIVGGKSTNLNGLHGRLADWIHLPKSIALPVGVLERVLADERNRRLRDECEALIAAAGENPSDALAKVRAKVLELSAPPDLQGALQEQWRRAGLPSVPWEQMWHAIRRVWASKWN